MFEPLAVISTAHLKPETCDRLQNDDSAMLPVHWGVTTYGFLIACGSEDSRAEIAADFPDIAAALAFCKGKGADFVLFDRDAAEVAGLETFEHEIGGPAPPRI